MFSCYEIASTFQMINFVISNRKFKALNKRIAALAAFVIRLGYFPAEIYNVSIYFQVVLLFQGKDCLRTRTLQFK